LQAQAARERREEEIQTLISDMASSADRRVASVRQEHAKEIEEIMAQLDLVEAEHKQRHHDVLTHKDAVIAALGVQLAEARSKKEELESKQGTQIQQLQALTKELDLARKEAETRVESMEALKTEHKKALDAEKKKRLVACEQARNDTIAEAEKQFNEANAHYLKLKKEYESCVAKVGKLEKELKAVRRELETTRTDVASREAEWTADLAQEKAGMCFWGGEMNMCIGQPAELTDCLCT